MPKAMIIFGTRPEAVKLAPLILNLQSRPRIETKVVVTAQHRRMLDQVIEVFGLTVHHDLDVMVANQSLFHITTLTLTGLQRILEEEKPDIVFVQGDTTTTFAAALASYFLRIPLGHVEAGLRTHDKYRPFPEEINRTLTSRIADFHFAPTEKAKKNLLREGIPGSRIYVTGNTVTDALKIIIERLSLPQNEEKIKALLQKEIGPVHHTRLLLVTGHRRESFGEKLDNICTALKRLSLANPDVLIVYPVHMNPKVESAVRARLGGIPNIRLIQPLPYLPFVYLMSRAYLILTDSGGVQEEAPSLGKPVLVMREVTERPEGIESGVAKLVGCNTETIFRETQSLLDREDVYAHMARISNPYGDGKAAERIVRIIEREVL